MTRRDLSLGSALARRWPGLDKPYSHAKYIVRYSQREYKLWPFSMLTVPLSRLYERVRRVIPPIEWPVFAADIEAILRLKRERDAIILAHNYQTPEIFHCVADVVGDSLALAREAAKSDAASSCMAGVHFMAETAKLLNPAKTVLIPDAAAGCSLAESIDADDVRLLRQPIPARRSSPMSTPRPR